MSIVISLFLLFDYYYHYPHVSLSYYHYQIPKSPNIIIIYEILYYYITTILLSYYQYIKIAYYHYPQNSPNIIVIILQIIISLLSYQ